jgi:hypothetical protein
LGMMLLWSLNLVFISNRLDWIPERSLLWAELNPSYPWLLSPKGMLLWLEVYRISMLLFEIIDDRRFICFLFSFPWFKMSSS